MNFNDRFTEIYGTGSTPAKYFSPGRVNLIGEHTDYNGGYVFPCALDLGTYGLARKRDDRTVKFASTNVDLQVECNVDGIVYQEEHGWTNYLKGVIVEFQKLGFDISGFEVLISGNIPNGSGLSSSASVEMLTSVIINDMFDCKLDMLEMVKLSQRAENKFIGVNCGIMDQFSIGMGKKNHAMFLKCSTMEYRYVPLEMSGYKLVIANTNKRRGLADSKYNERRSECERAVEMLQKELDIKFLGDIGLKEFDSHKHLITDSIILKRAEHIINEDERVLAAVDRLNHNDIPAFGKLMNESHVSLRDLYEVTGIELDTLAEAAWGTEGVAGSRMTGAGFGGCTVSVVQEDFVDGFKQKVGEVYKQKTGLEASFYISEVGGGAAKL